MGNLLGFLRVDLVVDIIVELTLFEPFIKLMSFFKKVIKNILYLHLNLQWIIIEYECVLIFF